VQPAGATPGAAVAAKFIDLLASAKGQMIIREYGRDKHGKGPCNNASYAKQYDD
jgi:tungstate transport system substrate-binding protein